MSDSSLDKKIEKLLVLIDNQNKKIDRISKILSRSIDTEQMSAKRAKFEQFDEQDEHMLTTDNLNRIRGKHRELLALLINNGFHTYKQIAEKMSISPSRARAYVAELKRDFKVPLRQVKDPEGLKVGIDVHFVEKILAFR